VSVKPGEDIEKLHVHRHMGVDFILITQHPQRINKTVRDLVGRHVHVRKLFGLNRAMLYEWDHCHNVASLKDAVKTVWAYPREVFRLYTSAEVHTKPKAVIPKSLFLIPIAAVVAVVSAYVGLKSIHSGFGATNKSGGQVSTMASGPSDIAGVSSTAPSSDGGSETWRVVGRYALGSRAFVVVANERGALRVEDSSRFVGEGLATVGTVDGHLVGMWSGKLRGLQK
jgi:zona occludens toxin